MNLQDLIDWFLSYELPDEVMRNQLAMERWNMALSSPTIGNIYSFYYCGALDRYGAPVIEWRRIK